MIFFDPLGRPPVVIIVFTHVVRTYKNLAIQNKQVKTMFITGEIVGTAKWIIDEACLVLISF